MCEILFTTSSLLDLLSQIDELKDLDIRLVEDNARNLQLGIGSSLYDIPTANAEAVEVAQDTLQDVSDINEDAYAELSESGEIDLTANVATVKSGAVKQLLKTLLVGGMVRLTSKLVK